MGQTGQKRERFGGEQGGLGPGGSLKALSKKKNGLVGETTLGRRRPLPEGVALEETGKILQAHVQIKRRLT